MFFMPAKACKEYHLEGRLIGHKNTINCLTISSNGSLLASGGSDGMRIWDLKQQLQLPSLRQNMGLQNPVNPVTCACWITRQEAVRETLCYGTGLGFIGIWQQQGEGIEDFDAKVSRRIGTVFRMYDGEVHVLQGTDRVIIATNNARPLIYNTNLIKMFPKQVVFGEKTDVVVSGSDAGVIYIFDKNEGTLKQVLKHADKARVQTVTRCLTDYKTYDGTHHSMIVGATSQNDAEPVISIWRRQWENFETACPPLGKALKNFVRGIVQLAIAMALLAYVSHVCVTMNTSISFKSLGNIW
ncbi:hypothetical protein BDR05DRAFT_949587 [Suillus weaverae]|nr:hypothetical protein BDR05DRAFT_949587 [Suillus weaverae]